MFRISETDLSTTREHAISDLVSEDLSRSQR
jgi:hypothetical protein